MKRKSDQEFDCDNTVQDNNDNIMEVEQKDDNGPSASKKGRKKTSAVWKHFSIKVSDVDEKSQFSHCNYCEKKYAYSEKANGGTGTLKKHILSAHPDKWLEDPAPAVEQFVFSQQRYREALVTWIIMSDQPFLESTNEYFLEMIKTLNSDAVTICNQTVKRDIMEMFARKIEEIKAKLNKATGKFSFTIDAWTSKNVLPFMAIRAHWIDDEWVYQTVLLDFCYIEGKHDGENFCNIFLQCLKRFDIPLLKVLAITMDNATPNDTFMDSLEKHGIKLGIDISSIGNRVRCMPHILNLAVQDILDSLKIPINNEEDKYEHLDRLEESDDADIMSKLNFVEEEDQEEEVCEGVENQLQPTVPKLRKLIKKVRKSPQMRQKLRKLCELYDLKYLVPIIDVKTRWNSTFLMIERAAYLKDPLRTLCSDEKCLNEFLMNENEWKELNTVSELLQKFHRSTKLLSMERHPTISAYLPTLKWLLESVRSFIDESSGTLAHAAEQGFEKLKKYEKLLEVKTSKLPYVATFLNPALKMSFFKEHEYSKPSIREIQKSICEVFERQYGSDNAKNTDEKAEEETRDEFFDYMFKRSKSNKEPKEFQKYLNFPLSSEKVNVLDFWRSQKEDFPNLSVMARDYLAIQSGSVAVERDFSMGVDLITATRCRLMPETVRACMCLKSWNKNLVITFPQ